MRTVFNPFALMMPFATRLEAKNEEEVLLKTLIIEGVMDIQAGHSAKVIEQKLYAQIPPEKRKVSEE